VDNVMHREVENANADFKADFSVMSHKK
jgi:hypothetical protein